MVENTEGGSELQSLGWQSLSWGSMAGYRGHCGRTLFVGLRRTAQGKLRRRLKDSILATLPALDKHTGNSLGGILFCLFDQPNLPPIPPSVGGVCVNPQKFSCWCICQRHSRKLSAHLVLADLGDGSFLRGHLGTWLNITHNCLAGNWVASMV